MERVNVLTVSGLGSVMMASVPTPFMLLIARLPPCRLTRARAIGSPGNRPIRSSAAPPGVIPQPCPRPHHYARNRCQGGDQLI